MDGVQNISQVYYNNPSQNIYIWMFRNLRRLGIANVAASTTAAGWRRNPKWKKKKNVWLRPTIQAQRNAERVGREGHQICK